METRTTNGIHGLSSLNEVAVRPKPVERQNVSNFIRIFSDETLHTLKVHPGLDQQEVEGMITFVQKVNTMWKILNVRSRNKDVIRNYQKMTGVRKTDDQKLTELLYISTMFGNMCKNSPGKRQRTLTRDTGRGLVHTLTGLVDLCRTLLSRSHQYVLIGHFTTYPLEKEFSKLRQASGGTYFLSFQQVVEKLDISKTKQLLKLKEDVRNLEVDVGHRCSKCCFSLDEVTCDIFDSLPKLEENVADETKMALVHAAGYRIIS